MNRKALRKRLLGGSDAAEKELAALLTVAPHSAPDESALQRARHIVGEHAEIATRRRSASQALGRAKKEGSATPAMIDEVAAHDRQLRYVLSELDALLDALPGDSVRVAHARGTLGDARPMHCSQTFCPPYLAKPGACDSVAADLPLLLDDAVDDAQWNGFVHGHDQATAYHDARWRHVFQRSLGHDTHYLAARGPRGDVHGVLPLVCVSSRLFGKQLVSLPFLNYGGPLATSVRVAEWLRRKGAARATQLGCDIVEFREAQPVADWSARRHKVTMTRRLPASVQELDRTLGSKLRSQCRRAEREGARVSTGGVELLDDYYRVFARNMRDLGTPVLPRAFFNEILVTFPESTRLVLVHLGARPVAAAFLIAHGKAVEIPWASSLRRYNRLAVNMMLYRAVLAEAIQDERTWFDFGRSSVDAPTFRFKQQWGAEPTQLHWHFKSMRGDSTPGLDAASVKNRLLSWGWRRTPLVVTNRLGPVLARGMP